MPAVIHPSGMHNRIANARLKAGETVAGYGMHISQAKECECRFIAGDGPKGFVCGAPTSGGPWCEDHRRKVFDL